MANPCYAWNVSRGHPSPPINRGDHLFIWKWKLTVDHLYVDHWSASPLPRINRGNCLYIDHWSPLCWPSIASTSIVDRLRVDCRSTPPPLQRIMQFKFLNCKQFHYHFRSAWLYWCTLVRDVRRRMRMTSTVWPGSTWYKRHACLSVVWMHIYLHSL